VAGHPRLPSYWPRTPAGPRRGRPRRGGPGGEHAARLPQRLGRVHQLVRHPRAGPAAAGGGHGHRLPDRAGAGRRQDRHHEPAAVAIRFAARLRNSPDPTANARAVALWEGIRRPHGAPPARGRGADAAVAVRRPCRLSPGNARRAAEQVRLTGAQRATAAPGAPAATATRSRQPGVSSDLGRPGPGSLQGSPHSRRGPRRETWPVRRCAPSRPRSRPPSSTRTPPGPCPGPRHRLRHVVNQRRRPGGRGGHRDRLWCRRHGAGPGLPHPADRRPSAASPTSPRSASRSTNAPIRYGDFLNAVISFLLNAAAVYFAVVLPGNKLMARSRTEPEPAAATRACPDCMSKIPEQARRCAFCTAQLTPAACPSGPT
jgi:hypothetical protein